MSEHTAVVFGLYADAVWHVTRPVYATDRICIEATRVAVMAGRAFSYPIEPVAVRCGSATADWWAFPEDKAGAPGWSVGVVGTGRRDRDRNTWDGHLVGYLPTGPDDGFLLDVAAPQRHRPQRGLMVPLPVVVPVCRDQLADGFAVAGPAGTVHWYRASDDTGWRRAGAWTNHRRLIARLAGQTIRRHREQLDVLTATVAGQPTGDQA